MAYFAIEIRPSSLEPWRFARRPPDASWTTAEMGIAWRISDRTVAQAEMLKMAAINPGIQFRLVEWDLRKFHAQIAA